MSTQSTIVKCSNCEKTYKRIYELRRHVKQVHPDNFVNKYKSYQFTCSECNKNFTHKAHLKFHIKKFHTSLNVIEDVRPRKKCVFCDHVVVYYKDLLHHYTETHNISIISETIVFATYDEFLVWKSGIEKESQMKFIVERGSRNGTINFICHRSGFYKSEGKGLRHIKTQGTKKIDGICPATMRVVAEKDGKYSVNFVKTHVGHKNDLGHLFLTHTERKTLATKIASGIPFHVILDSIRDSTSSCSSLDRLHLLTIKDLYNIEASFNLQSTSIRHENDAVSLDSWVHDADNNCVLFYKPQNTISDEYPQLKNEDFALIIMNEGQANVFKTFSNDCICVDGTFGMNNYDFQLHTLLVLDNLREGFPCAFCISNRSDEIILNVFFECVKKECGLVQTKVFMTDMADSYYNAWSKVMTEPEFRLYCTWHVDKAWRKNLSLINLKDKQAVVYKILRTLLQETDVTAFERMLPEFLTKLLNDTDTCSFGTYFKNNYVMKTKSWAYCYRVNSTLNTNMHIERMHRTIKYIYLGGKKVKRLDKSIHALMRFVRDKLYDRLIVLSKGKISSKLKELRKRHQASEKLDTQAIMKTDDFWQILSSSGKEVYNIYENDNNCDCQLICMHCEKCIHRYSCSCIDSAIRWNMCKHIHLLCKYRKLEDPLPEQVMEGDEENQDLQIFKDSRKMEMETIFETVHSKPRCLEEKSLAEQIQQLHDRYLSILNNIKSKEQVEVLKRALDRVEPTLAALETPFNNFVEKQTAMPHNKKIDQQRRLFSTKKKGTRKIPLISKPTQEESSNIALSLLN